MHEEVGLAEALTPLRPIDQDWLAPERSHSYGLSAVLMITGAIFEHVIGVEAAGKSLESVSKLLQTSS